jgi:replicative DNA helicase
MKLVSASMEKAVIKLITTSEPKLSHFALSNLRAEHFGYPATHEAFERISYLAKKQDEVITWQELINDAHIAESSRDILGAYTKKPQDTSRATITRFVNVLDRYRKMRVVFNASMETLVKLKADKVDIDKVIDAQYDGLSKAKASSKEVATVVNYGSDNNSTYLIKDLLEGKTKPSLPTGIRAFDDRNVGIFFGSMAVLAATSGAGKSAVALNIAKHMAKHGAKVCFVPLEMDEVETNQRVMADEAEIDMGKMINPRLFTSADKIKLKRKFKAFTEELKKKGAKLTVWKPTEDVTIDDIFFHLKPMGYNAIFIDYISLLAGVGGDDQWQKLSDVARAAKVYASVNNCVVILLAQLNEDMSVRYSKAIFEHANNAIVWIRDQKSMDTHILHMIQKKARNQSNHSFSVLEEFQFMRVRDVPEGYTPQVEQQSVSSKGMRRGASLDKGDYFADSAKKAA